MDLLAKIGQAYSSGDSDQEAEVPQVSLAPEVDVSDLVAAKEQKELSLFETTNIVSTKPNHLSGVVERVHINPTKFHEQYHNFESFGHALNPSDNAINQLVYSSHVRKFDGDSTVEGGTSMSRKAYRKALKRTRQ